MVHYNSCDPFEATFRCVVWGAEQLTNGLDICDIFPVFVLGCRKTKIMGKVSCFRNEQKTGQTKILCTTGNVQCTGSLVFQMSQQCWLRIFGIYNVIGIHPNGKTSQLTDTWITNRNAIEDAIEDATSTREYLHMTNAVTIGIKRANRNESLASN